MNEHWDSIYSNFLRLLKKLVRIFYRIYCASISITYLRTSQDSTQTVRWLARPRKQVGSCFVKQPQL
nr:hypothetical protein Iba_chr02cCG13960 [Ipomoea batatas]GME03442.1 hypothetical protein Iba_scaffold686CG0850 [Ipomoea batatas]